MTTVTDLTLRRFAVHVPDEDLTDLRRRIAAMRWPGKELVSDTSQGVQLATSQDLVTYWGFTDAERAALAAFGARARKGYNAEQSQAPQTIGYSLTDSPAGLAAWMLDHYADSYKKISRAFVEGHPVGGLTRDRILDNITLYWLTNTATSAARMYWEGARSTAAASGHAPPEVSLAVAFTVFPDEIFQAPRSWAEKVYPNLVYFHQADRGGHFAAWEEPALFTEELRAGFRSLR